MVPERRHGVARSIKGILFLSSRGFWCHWTSLPVLMSNRWVLVQRGKGPMTEDSRVNRRLGSSVLSRMDRLWKF